MANSLGVAIKLARVSREMRIVELAEKARMSTSHISMLENDMRDPTYGALERIAKALGMPLIVLVFLAQESEDMDGELERLLSPYALRVLTGHRASVERAARGDDGHAVGDIA